MTELKCGPDVDEASFADWLGGTRTILDSDAAVVTSRVDIQPKARGGRTSDARAKRRDGVDRRKRGSFDTAFAITRGVMESLSSSGRSSGRATPAFADLLLGSRGAQNQKRIGIIANRLKTNSRGSQRLQGFLQNFDIPTIATLRDSVNYTRGAELGIGIHELPAWQTRKDLDAWEAILNWVQGESKCYDSNPNMPLRVGLSGAVRVALGRHQTVS